MEATEEIIFIKKDEEMNTNMTCKFLYQDSIFIDYYYVGFLF